MKLLPTYLFFKLFRLFLHFKQYLWGITPRFVQRFIGFLFIEEAVQSVAWVPEQVLINCPAPPYTIFRELVKNCLGFCCFVTIKDLPLGFFWVKNSIGTISPGGVWGGRSPPKVSTPFLPGSVAAAAAAADPKSCFDFAENRAANSLWVGSHRYQRILCASKLLWVYSDFKLGDQFCQFSIKRDFQSN